MDDLDKKLKAIKPIYNYKQDLGGGQSLDCSVKVDLSDENIEQIKQEAECIEDATQPIKVQ